MIGRQILFSFVLSGILVNSNPGGLAYLIQPGSASTAPTSQLVALRFNFKLPSRGAPRGRRSAGPRDSACPKLDVGNGVTAPREKLLKSAQPYSNLISKIIDFGLQPCEILYIQVLKFSISTPHGCKGWADLSRFFVALVPEPEPESAFGLTNSERPTFWFYLPFAPRSQVTEEVEFVLVDTETEKDIYQTTFTLQGTPGILGIPLPKNQPALAVGKQYRWALSYICQPQNRQEDIAIDGVVERVALDPTVSNQLQTAKSDRDRILVYAENGLWYDALTALAQLYQSQPQDETLKADWFDLLKSVGLENLAEKPILTESY